MRANSIVPIGALAERLGEFLEVAEPGKAADKRPGKEMTC